MRRICRKCSAAYANGNSDFCSNMECRLKGNVSYIGNCWLWQGCVNANTGYGKFVYKGRTVSAHRVSYEFFVGPIPEGKIVCHAPRDVCGNRNCINPEHLSIGDYKSNQRDRITDGTGCTGRKQYAAHSAEFVLFVLNSLREGKLTVTQVESIYGVAATTVRSWVKGKSRRGHAII